MDVVLGSLWNRVSSVAVTTLVASGVWWVDPNATSPPLPRIQTNDPWVKNVCDWWNLTDGAATESTLCTNMAVFRYTASHASEGLLKATECARATGESCILSHEAGTHVPGVYIYDHETNPPGMRFLVHPTVIEGGGVVRDDLRRVRVSSLVNAASRIAEMNNTVLVEFFDHAKRTISQVELAGNDAFCVQLLKLSVGAECLSM